MNDLEKAIKTISDIYSEYLSSETDTVNLKPYDEALQQVDTVLEQALQEKAERDNPPPLTLEQLNQRVGKPVWCSRNKQYGIISKAEDGFQIWFCDGWESLEVFISKPIYDHEPKEINTK